MTPLIALAPEWIGAGGPGITRQGEPVERRYGIGIWFKCPCPALHDEFDRVFVAFRNPLDGGPCLDGSGHRWDREGESFDTLTLRPSILRLGGCGWHGFVTNGEVTTA